MNPKVMAVIQALNKYEKLLRRAVRDDALAEQKEHWETGKLRALDATWMECRIARRELEALIQDYIQ